MRNGFSAVLGLIAIGLLVGCGADIGDRQAIEGEVTFQGAPLDQGVIQFTPKSGGARIFAGAVIVNGRYEIPAADGLSPGTYEVRVSSGAPAAAEAEAMPGESGPLAEERIPAEFNVETTLEYTVRDDAPNQYDITIP